jgi:hypothetical protein
MTFIMDCRLELKAGPKPRNTFVILPLLGQQYATDASAAANHSDDRGRLSLPAQMLPGYF